MNCPPHPSKPCRSPPRRGQELSVAGLCSAASSWVPPCTSLLGTGRRERRGTESPFLLLGSKELAVGGLGNQNTLCSLQRNWGNSLLPSVELDYAFLSQDANTGVWGSGGRVGRVLEAAVLIPGGPSEAYGAVPSTSLHSCSVTEQRESCPGGLGWAHIRPGGAEVTWPSNAGRRESMFKVLPRKLGPEGTLRGPWASMEQSI